MGVTLAFPPRMMRRATAAAYLELSVPEFEREIAAGRLPMPVKLGNHERWSTAAIDQAIARLAGEAGSTWREKASLYAQAG